MSKPILWIVIPCYNEEKVLQEPGALRQRRLQGRHLGADLQICTGRRAFHRHFSEPEPRPPERCAGRTDGGQGKWLRHHHLHRLRRAGRHRRHGRDGPEVSGWGRGGLRRAQPPRHRHLLQAVHRRGLLPPDERAGRGHRVQPRRLPPDKCPRAGELCRLQRSQHLPARHGAAGGFPQRNGQLRAPRAPRRREPLPLEQDAGAGL